MYGHGDVVRGRGGEEWRDNLDPWRTRTSGDRVLRAAAPPIIRGSTASICRRFGPCARRARRAGLGFNAKFIIENRRGDRPRRTLRQVCESLRDQLAADLFLASDGPRLAADRPTIFLGCRGGSEDSSRRELARWFASFPANWGGVLAKFPQPSWAGAHRNPGRWQGGGLLLDQLKPPRISNQIRATLADVKIEPTAGEARIVGELGRGRLCRRAERLYAWNTLEVLAIVIRQYRKSPPNAIPGRAQAVLQLRFVVGTRADKVVDAVRAHFATQRLSDGRGACGAKFLPRREPISTVPWINWGGGSRSGRPRGKSARGCCRISAARCPTTCFPISLGLPTIWVPHSYPGCSQHAPDEHILLPVTEEALGHHGGFVLGFGRDAPAAVLETRAIPAVQGPHGGRKLHSIPARFMQALSQPSKRGEKKE